MKTVYDMDDIFLAAAVVLIGVGIALRIFNTSWDIVLITVTARNFFDLGIVSLLFNIALNIHELARNR